MLSLNLPALNYDTSSKSLTRLKSYYAVDIMGSENFLDNLLSMFLDSVSYIKIILVNGDLNSWATWDIILDLF